MGNDMDRNILDVIKCETSNDVLVTKSVVENFNTKSQLIVNESQEALFYKDGHALDLFGAGRHSLNTENLPFLKRLYGAIFGGKNPFTCEVFYINKVNVLDIMWGTDSPIEMEDPKYNLLVKVRANGQTGLVVKDSRKFVVKIVGQMREFTVDNVRRSIKGIMMTYIKEAIAQAIIDECICILDISTKLSMISKRIQERLNAELDDLGIEIVHFQVGAIMSSEEDLAELRKIKNKMSEITRLRQAEADARAYEIKTQADAEAYRTKVESEAIATGRAIQGYGYQEERKYDVMQSAAQNNGNAGGFIGAGIGLGMGFGVMEEAKRMTSNTINNAATATRICPNCQSEIPKQSKFCPECGNQLPPEVRFCSECGTKLTPGAKFCPECGTKAQ